MADITLNRMGNVKNPYQGTDKKVLCVCSAGLLRSPTAANVLHREYGFNTRACGVNENFALIVLDPLLLLWADEVVCMNQEQTDKVLDMMGEAGIVNKHVVNLDVPDVFEYMDSNLQSLIIMNYKESLENE